MLIGFELRCASAQLGEQRDPIGRRGTARGILAGRARIQMDFDQAATVAIANGRGYGQVGRRQFIEKGMLFEDFRVPLNGPAGRTWR